MSLRTKYNELEKLRAHYYDLWIAEMRRREKTAAKSDAQIDNIIDALGMRDAYPNTITGADSYGNTITAYGRNKFLADVQPAADAARGNEAAARLAAALKPTK